MSFRSAPCDWPLLNPTDPDGCTPCSGSTLLDLPEAERERFVRMAVELLWAWTGRKFGTCEETVRPCRSECSESETGSTFYGFSGTGAGSPGLGLWRPVLLAGEWFNIRCGYCGDRCHCSVDTSRHLSLPGPVAEIVEVWVDGERLGPEKIWVEGDTISRLDGKPWPWCNTDLGDPTDPESGAWTVTYKRGLSVPVGGQIAAQKLAEELAKAACSDSSCELPSRVQSVTRQGVSMEMVQTEFQDVREGRTGIWLIDSWVASTQAPEDARPAVFSPDVPRGAGRGTYNGLGRGRTW